MILKYKKLTSSTWRFILATATPIWLIPLQSFFIARNITQEYIDHDVFFCMSWGRRKCHLLGVIMCKRSIPWVEQNRNCWFLSCAEVNRPCGNHKLIDHVTSLNNDMNLIIEVYFYMIYQYMKLKIVVIIIGVYFYMHEQENWKL